MKDKHLLVIITVVAIFILLANAVPVHIYTAAATGSMEPVIHGGDDIYVLAGWAIGELNVGDIVTYKPNGDDSAIPMLHRIVEIRDNGTIVTKGDANEYVDEGREFDDIGVMHPVKKEWVTGKLIYINHVVK
jgi:signal peptidase